MLKLINLILCLILLYAILFGNTLSFEKFEEEGNTFEVPYGNSNTDQTVELTRSLMIIGSQSDADSEYDNDVGSIDRVTLPPGTS